MPYIYFKNKKGYRHWDFPSGPPPQYQPSLKALNFGVRMGSGVFTLVWPITKLIKLMLSTLGLPKRSPTLVLTQPQGAQLRSSNGIRCFHLSMADNKINTNYCYRHWDFPSGPPPQYQPSLKALNFGVRMGSGVFTLVWPITKLIKLMSTQKI
ncbi:MFS transporter (macronuclear) [Tetrahymena thermophila SB210]|uniref:MFS transporter n=1 Tax=Tetrahymena thermophila (strain SB210) TaxID=312017 RepID=W7XJ26_TETTS|nr:MFS transporter [Tetrahymena thermophila SB210]EWS75151.1 MFS transporter [Tetrahymena thermophila SB210]|eukprot:XP_012652307.1 MFS transporter [Tetrahymena thermophila SB210]